MLSPIVPHISHALWQELGHESRRSSMSAGRTFDESALSRT